MKVIPTRMKLGPVISFLDGGGSGRILRRRFADSIDSVATFKSIVVTAPEKNHTTEKFSVISFEADEGSG